jgi:hypothetical protein
MAVEPHQPMSTTPKNKANLRVIEEWPIPGGLPRSGLITWKFRCSDRELLLCEDGGEHCFHLNLKDRLLTKVEWPKPDWAKVQERNGYIFYEKGARDISVSSGQSTCMAAVATKANYAFCWKLGSNTTKIIEKGMIHRVAVAPDGEFIACGTGKWVLDAETPAQASVFIWDLGSDECIAERNLPGCCVTSLLWIHDEERGYIYSTEFEAYQQLIVATTMTRNQKSGFVVVMDPIDLRIIEISETPYASAHDIIKAWPEYRLVLAGGMRELGSSFHTLGKWSCPGFAHQATKTGSDLWLDESHVFRLQYSDGDILSVQILEQVDTEIAVDTKASKP